MKLTLTQRLLWRVDSIKAMGLRALLGDAGEDTRLRKRIRERIKELGRWYEDGNSDLLGYSYHPIPFEGFESVKNHRGACEERLEAILGELKVEKGDWILDIGANVGFFSFGLEREGAIVEAYEPHSSTFEIGAALSKLHHRNVLFINKKFGASTLDYLRPHYKAVLLLSVFHWVVRQEGEKQAAYILGELAKHADYIFFEAPSDPGDGMAGGRCFDSKEMVETFLSRSIPRARVTLLHQDRGWGARFLYKIDCTSV